LSTSASKKSQLITYVVVIAIAVGAGFLLVKGGLAYLRKGNIVTFHAGDKLPIREIDLSRSDRTLILVLSEGCRFCSENAPFYRQLVRECRARNISTAAALPQDISEGQEYLKRLGVAVDEVRQVNIGALRLRTPMLILVNKDGTVISSWLGMLPPEREREVLAQL